jgi:putative ABC transport system ATP-binding protein
MITLEHVTKLYGPAGAEQVRALDDVSLRIEEGEHVSLIGASGSGKSTLLNLLGGIDAPSSGSIIVGGRDITRIGDRAMTLLRREMIGIVFQFFNLMPTLSVLENVMLPAELAGENEATARTRALDLLAAVGMERRASHRPNELSGGEMQRTAIARALINRPRILLADEPTGNLDSHNGNLVLDLLRRIASEAQLTLVMATHDPVIAARAGRIVEMKDGKVRADTRREEEFRF